MLDLYTAASVCDSGLVMCPTRGTPEKENVCAASEDHLFFLVLMVEHIAEVQADDIPEPDGERMRQDAPTIRIRPSSGWHSVDFVELWRYRELLWILGTRDIKVRYKQTALGILWAIIPPLFTTLVFHAIFTLLGVTPRTVSNGLPYLLFAFTGQVPWQLFANSVTQSSNSLVASQQLITKVYFPRLIIPLASLFSALLDFLVGLLLLAGIMAWYRDSIDLSWSLLTLPFFVLLALSASLAVGLWMSAVNVQYRDVRYAVPVLVQLWMYVSPIMYSSSNIPEKWRVLYAINPMAGVADGFRWALLGSGQPAPGPMLLVSFLSVGALFVSGLFYFKRMERAFADVV